MPRLALYSGHRSRACCSSRGRPGCCAQTAAADVVGVEHRHVVDAVACGEIVRKRQAVHPAADDDDVVGRPQLVTLEERPVPEQAGHVVTRASTMRARAACSRQYAGTRIVRPFGLVQDLRGHTSDVALHEPPVCRGIEVRQVGERAPSVVAGERPRRPPVADVQHQRVGVERGDAILDLARDVRCPRPARRRTAPHRGRFAACGHCARARQAHRARRRPRCTAPTATSRSWSSATQPHPRRVVERCRDDRRRDVDGRERFGKDVVDGADPAEPDRRTDRFRHRARGDASDDGALDRERCPTLRCPVEPQADELAV